MHKRSSARALAIDAIAIIASIVIALALAETNLLLQLMTNSRTLEYVGSFIAGIFFTSVFTIAPAIATLGEIARVDGVWITALLGALGAMVGDLLIFKFIKDRFSEHLAEYLAHWHGVDRARELIARPSLRWLAWTLGGIVIASPLPDELGVVLIGAARMNAWIFALLAFVFNFFGIVVVGLAARAL